MLVLTRRIGETLVIDGNTTVRVLASSGGKVRLGVEAPASVRVQRSPREDNGRSRTGPSGG